MVARSLVVVALLLICSLAGCGRDGRCQEPVATPQITLVYPEDGATGIRLNTPIAVRFSRDMDEASLDSIYVIGVPTHRREYNASTRAVVLYLDSLLEPEIQYQVRISSDCRDTHANKLSQDSVFAFTTGPFDCEHVQDYLEHNDEIGWAASVSLNETYKYLSSCGGQERHDYFRFELRDTAKVSLSVSIAHTDTSRVAWVFGFLRNDGSSYRYSVGTLEFPHDFIYSYTFLPGDYYVETGKWNADNHLILYHLAVETSSPCPDDTYEDNDFFDQVTLIAEGAYVGLRACFWDRDYYGVNLAPNQQLTVIMTERTSTDRNRMLYIYGPDQQYLVGQSDKDNPKVETWTATDAGLHYVKVSFPYDGVVYDLEVHVD